MGLCLVPQYRSPFAAVDDWDYGMAVDYVCTISASIVWHNVEYVKGRLCTKNQLNVLSGFHRRTCERNI